MSGSVSALNALVQPVKSGVDYWNDWSRAQLNALAVQKAQGEQAVGQAWQQAIDPQTGELDINKFRQNVAKAGPAAAFAAQSGMGAGQAISSNQLQQAQQKIGQINGALGALLDKPNVGASDVMGSLTNLVANGVLTPQEAARELATLPSDPTALRTALQQHQLRGLALENQIGQIYPTVGQQTAPGGVSVPILQQPGRKGGALSQGAGGVLQGLPATVLDQPFPYLDDKGRQKSPTLRQFMIDHGYTFAAEGGPGGAPGSLPSSLRGTGAQSSAPNVPQPGPKEPQTSPSKAELAQMEGEATTSVEGFRNISKAATASRDRSAILGNMLGDVSQFTTGPLAGIVSRLRNLGINLGVPGLNVEGQSAQESFNKLAAQLANAQGAGSDSRMLVNIEANPHQELSPAGATLMIHQLQGNEDYLQARGNLAAAYPDQKNVNKFETEMRAKLDPRAFQFHRMTVPERQTYVKNLSPTDYAAVQKAYNLAHDQGWLPGG